MVQRWTKKVVKSTQKTLTTKITVAWQGKICSSYSYVIRFLCENSFRERAVPFTPFHFQLYSSSPSLHNPPCYPFPPPVQPPRAFWQKSHYRPHSLSRTCLSPMFKIFLQQSKSWLNLPQHNFFFILKNGPTPASISFIFVLSNKHYNFYNK